MKNSKNPSLPAFSSEIPTPKGEVEYYNYIFQLKLLQSSYTDDAIQNAMVATMRGHAKIAIRAIGYDWTGCNAATIGEQIQIRGIRGYTTTRIPPDDADTERKSK